MLLKWTFFFCSKIDDAKEYERELRLRRRRLRKEEVVAKLNTAITDFKEANTVLYTAVVK